MELNKFQTPINEETTKILTEESKQELQDLIVNVPYIKNLVSADREYARDRPRDSKGRIIVDVTKPHILEDMNYFTKAADHFRKHGCYTFLRKNGNKNSEYYKWAKEEIRRVLEGYVRESDGEWVTGDLYFFLNYAPMMVNELLEEGGGDVAVRVEDFPRTWEGIYLRFHYIEQARVGGLYNEFKGGNHAVELAKRGCGKSFSLAALMTKRLILGERIGVDKRVTTILTAYLKEYLSDKDGTLSKFAPMLDFCRENTPFPNALLKNAAREMSWQMGYIDKETDVKKGSLNTVMGVSVKDQVGKLRGKRGYILIEEFGSFPNLLQVYNNIRPGVESGKLVFGLIYCVGTAGDKESDFHAAQELMYYPTGYNVYALPNVYDKIGQGRANFCYFFPAYLNREGCIRENGVSDITKALIELLHMRDLARYNTSDPSTIIKVMAENPITPQEAILKVRNKIFPTADLDARILEIDNDPSFYNSIYTGELYFDDFGEVQFRPTSALPIRQFPHSDNKMEGSIEMSDLPVKGSDGKIPAGRYLMSCLKEGEMVNTAVGLKSVEDVTLEDKLINIEGEEVEIYNLQKYYNENPVYKVKLSSIIDSTTFSQEHPIYCCTPKRRYYSYNRVKKEGLPERYYEYNFDFRKVSELKVGDVVKSPILYRNEIIPSEYNNPDIWYLLGVIIGDGWAGCDGYSIHICFNSKELYLIDRCKNIIKTKFNRKFTLCKNRETYCEYSFCNKEFNAYIKKYFGVGAEYKHIDNTLKNIPYTLRKNFILGYLDTDGNITRNSINIVSISKRLLCDIQDWLFSLSIVSSVKLLRKAGTEFITGRICNTKNKYMLNIGTEGLNIIKEWGLDSMKVGSYNIVPISNHNRKDVFIKDDYIYLKIKSIDIEEYKGYVYNYECATHTFMCNYIPTHNCDPYDDDCSETVSLGSVFVMDVWTDRIVCEYTGRPAYADDFYEIIRKISLFYNARIMYEQNKKGLFSYFSKMNCVHFLLDTPAYLKEQHIIKSIGYGNKQKGVNATAAVNAFARERIAVWLTTPETKIIKNDSGEEIEVTRPKLYSIWNRALLQELATWNPEYNFDRVSSLGMMMIALQEVIIKSGGKINASEEKEEEVLGDPFFQIYDKKCLKKF